MGGDEEDKDTIHAVDKSEGQILRIRAGVAYLKEADNLGGRVAEGKRTKPQ